MGTQLVPTYLMKRYVEEGLGRAEIVRRLEKDHDIVVSPNAVSNWKRRYGYERQEQGLPWKLKPEHVFAYPARMVRLHQRLARGGKMPANDAGRLQRYLIRLAESDAVIHYDDRTEQGFFYVQRRKGIDEGIIREPSVP